MYNMIKHVPTALKGAAYKMYKFFSFLNFILSSSIPVVFLFAILFTSSENFEVSLPVFGATRLTIQEWLTQYSIVKLTVSRKNSTA